MLQSLRFGGAPNVLSVFALALGLGAASPTLASPPIKGGQTATVTQTEVDVELVLAVDVSFSMDMEEQQIQRQGYLDALRSEEFISAVRDGMLGKVALTYVEWGGSESQAIVVPWAVIDSPESANAFADQLQGRPLQKIARTSISSAIRFSTALIKNNPYEGLREVIDISGDGPNNSGEPVVMARDMAREAGVIINGLPLLMKRDNDGFDLEDLDVYYEQCVITGPGAFVIPVRGKDQFRDAIRSKIIREIASVTLPEPLVQQAAEKGKKKANCKAGEMMMRLSIP
jgi:hypothetical protein